MTSHTETEFKLRARQPVEVAQVDAALRELGVVCRLAETRRHTDTYFDDARGSLHAAGIGLRLREDHNGGRLQCKLRGRQLNGLFVRPELEATWLTEGLPRRADALAGELRDAVEPFVLDRQLEPRLRLQVQREVRVLTQHDEDLCELAIDRVEARAAGRKASFQEIEIEVFDDLPGNERLAQLLQQRLPLIAAERDKPSYATELLCLVPAPAAEPDDCGVLADAVTARAERRMRAMREAEVGVRRDDGPEHLHAMRVAIRRLRSLVRAFRELWPPETAARLQRDLRATGRRLGEVRDLDVLLAALPPRIADLPAGLQAEARLATEWIRQRRDAHRRALHDWLRSPDRLARAAAIEADLAAMARDGELAHAPIAAAAPPRLVEAVDRLRRLAASIAPDLPIDTAHRLRLAAKRVRYLGEEFAALPGADYGKSLRRVVRVQQRFGELCDHEVAAERLLGWLPIAAQQQPDGPALAAALGGLATLHHRAIDGARARARRSLRRVDHKRVWGRFETWAEAGPGHDANLA